MTLHQEHFSHGKTSGKYPEQLSLGKPFTTASGLTLTLSIDAATQGSKASGFISPKSKKHAGTLVVGDMSTLRIEFDHEVENVWLDYYVMTDITPDDIKIDGVRNLALVGTNPDCGKYPSFFNVRFLAEPKQTNAAFLSRMTLGTKHFRAIEIETNRSGQVHIASIAWETKHPGYR
jgi:hypothetical protein